MAKKILCVMAGYDDKTEEYLAGIQQKLYDDGFSGIQTKNIPMHITLGTFSVDKEEELKELVTKVAEEHRSFEVSFSHVGLFKGDGNNVLFIAPDANREMLDLRECFGDIADWAAHTTMIIDNPATVNRALPVVMDNFEQFRGTVKKIYLYEFWPARHIITTVLK